MRKTNEVPGTRGVQSAWGRFVDENEGYGTHVMESLIRRIPSPSSALDLGAGGGRDLGMVKAIHPLAKAIAIDCVDTDALRHRFDAVHHLDIERARLPLADKSVDLVIANQVLEHLKEIFWVWHEVSRVLTVGGHFLIGVPNVASLHNRVLLTLGRHPTQWKSYSAHVRPFSKWDTLRFAEVCFPDGYELIAFQGAQFYPFPTTLSRALCAVFPAAAVSIFFLFRKRREYRREFIEHPVKAQLQTNFFLG